MFDSKEKTFPRSATCGFHTVPVSLDATRLGIVETTAVHRAPKVSIELEVGTATLLPHGAKDFLKVLLNLGMCSIQRVPGSVAPSAESHPTRLQGLAILAADKPLWVLLEDLRILLGNKRSDPNSGLEAALPNLFQDRTDIPPKHLAGAH